MDESGVGAAIESGDLSALEYRIQYQPITISVKCSISDKFHNDSTFSYELDGSVLKLTRNMIQIMASHDTRVSELIDLLRLESDPSEQYGLYTRGGERLKEDDFIWNVLEQNSHLVLEIAIYGI